MSKWTTRLKGALAVSEKTETCLNSALTITAKTPNEVVSSAFASGHSGEFPKTSVFHTTTPNIKKTETCLNSALSKADETNQDAIFSRLNVFIARGGSFDVGADEFAVNRADALTAIERQWLDDNLSVVLTTLQQSLLTKLIFDLAPDSLNQFAFDIYERESLMTTTGADKDAIYFQAVADTTKCWFTELLNGQSNKIFDIFDAAPRSKASGH